MEANIFEKLKQFTIKEASLTDEPLTRETKIEEDLGITGADAIEYLIAYGKHFKVDVSKFLAAEYFRAEGRSSFVVDSKKKKVLTLAHLEKGILAGILNDEVINS